MKYSSAPELCYTELSVGVVQSPQTGVGAIRKKMHADDRCVCQGCDPLYCVSNCSMTGSSGQVGCVYREADLMCSAQK
nr:MAG TPA_asm: hypothetical protein [Caudoviricetes sp.]